MANRHCDDSIVQLHVENAFQQGRAVGNPTANVEHLPLRLVDIGQGLRGTDASCRDHAARPAV